jgi:hypothetical protein
MRILRTPLGGLFLVGLAVGLAVLVLGQGGARPAAADPAEAHYECYDIVAGTPPDPAAVVNLETQFGMEHSVAVGPATKLCLPAAKDTTVIPAVPHLKCYTIDGPPVLALASVETQFGVQEWVSLGRAKLLCVPAIKTVLYPEPEPPSGPLLTVPHYKCYEIVGGANDPTGPHMLKTQFGEVPGVDVGPSHLLCLPAIKTILPDGMPEGSLAQPQLECYTLTGQAAPGRGVQLETQFGVEGTPAQPIEVGPATMLCTPVTASAVGGIAELPQVAGGAGDQAAAPDNGSGWSSANYAALAAGLAAAAVVLSAGAWYARRRWIR